MHFLFCKLPVLALVHLPNEILCSSYQHVQVRTQGPPRPVTISDDKQAAGTGDAFRLPPQGGSEGAEPLISVALAASPGNE